MSAHKTMRTWAESMNDSLLVDVRNGLVKLDPYLTKIGKPMAPDLMIMRMCGDWYGTLLKNKNLPSAAFAAADSVQPLM